MQTAMTRNPYFQNLEGGIVHPRAHRLRLTASVPYSPKYSVERSLTVSNFPISPRTAFEVERPQSQGSPRLIININTSFHKGILDYTSRKKRVPTFPQIAGERITSKRRDSRATDYEMRLGSRRHPSGSSLYRRDGTATSRRQSGQYAVAENKEMAAAEKRSSATHREPSAASLGRLADIANRRRPPSPEKRPASPGTMSSEKQLWISDWISSTSKAMNIDKLVQDPPVSTLSVIEEQ